MFFLRRYSPQAPRRRSGLWNCRFPENSGCRHREPGLPSIPSSCRRADAAWEHRLWGAWLPADENQVPAAPSPSRERGSHGFSTERRSHRIPMRRNLRSPWCAMVRVYKVPVLKSVMDVLMALSKAFPMNLVLLIFYLIWTTQFSSIAAFFHSQKTIKDVSLMYVAIAALVFCSLASISEIIRSGLISVDKGQYEAGYASGLTKAQTFFHVIVPQAVRAVIPPLTNDILSLVKGTALVSVIGVSDILTDSINAASAAYSYLEAYVAAALVFWGIGIVLERLSHYVERKFSKSVKTLAG